MVRGYLDNYQLCINYLLHHRPIHSPYFWILCLQFYYCMTDQARLSLSAQFERILSGLHNEMLEAEQKGDYVEADTLRQKAIIQKKQWEQQTIGHMSSRQAREVEALEQDYYKNMETCDREWKAKIEAFLQKARADIADIDRRNKKEEDQLRKVLGEQLPSKVKESYQLLNFREMERHMNKQKDYAQAHLMQQRIKQVYQAELKAWNEAKEDKIQQAIVNLRYKQAVDRELLTRRNQIQEEDQDSQWRLERLALQQRYNLQLKQLRGRQERELLSFRGSFSTKGGVFNENYDTLSC